MKLFQSSGMDNKKLFKASALNSLGTMVYITAVALFLNNAQKIFGKVEDTFFAPLIMLTLFVLSALITGLLLLGRPALLYFDGRKQDGLKLLFYTVISLVAILVFIILIYLGLS